MHPTLLVDHKISWSYRYPWKIWHSSSLGHILHVCLYIQDSYYFLEYNVYFHGDVHTKCLLFLCREDADKITTLCRHKIICLKNYTFLKKKKNYTFLSDLTYVTPSVFSHLFDSVLGFSLIVSGADFMAQLSWGEGTPFYFSYSHHSVIASYGKRKHNRPSNTVWMFTNTSYLSS